ncbi:AfsR/SARP family transcriptional regulator [Micromonospora sp. CB01531]|uniref:AfsR/SARP family transcriptional regulator n=1 Tax=Micromonospora sp. CB01531 TaxID=1718947 RepID=UPI00093CE236|nr:BTAD domain-containing putative transcriptional regulator [Micromonospora sp. CB01531]OKI85251.1 hypothetical protein A6A27_40165 [Micromonospora sp. CB01531]
MVFIRVLGSLEAETGCASTNLGGPRQRAILALLVAARGQVVSIDRLIEDLWGGEPPAQALKTLQSYVSNLRKLLEPGREPGTPARFLVSASPGYALRLDEDSVDAWRFERLSFEAREVMSGDPASARRLLDEALSLWRGGAFAEVADEPWAAAEAGRLEELRLSARELRVAAALRSGHVLGAALEAERLIGEQPLREEGWRLYALALWAEGRQADALAALRRVRSVLATELGLNPGPALVEIEEAILTQRMSVLQAAVGSADASDPAQASHSGPSPTDATEPAGTGGNGVSRVVRPAQLPLAMPLFSGRRAELAALDALLPADGGPPATVVTVALDGIPGIGKSTLAVHWAHTVAHRFPDGQLFVNLRGFDYRGAVVTVAGALSGFLSAMGVPTKDMPTDVEALAALYRSTVAGRRMLVVLDNARDAEHIQPLIPGSPGCLVIVTSRNRLTGLVAHAGAHPLTLGVPSMDEARDALRRRVGQARAAWEPEALDEIIERCGRLPLALAIVAARAVAHPGLSLGRIAADIRASRGSLDAFSGDDPKSDVRSVFSWSYQMLSPAAARLFRLLSLFPGPDIGLPAAASLAGIPRREAAALVGELTRTRLLTEDKCLRYSFHDLIRTYAMELAEEQEPAVEQRTTMLRIFDHYRQTAHAAHLHFRPTIESPTPPAPLPSVTPEVIDDASQAMAWFMAERHNLQIAVGWAARHGLAPAWPFALTLLMFYQRTGMALAWANTAQIALDAAYHAHDLPGQAHMHRILAGADHYSGHNERAIDHLERAQRLFEQLDYPMEHGYTQCNMGWIRYSQGHHEQALKLYEEAFDLFIRADHRQGQAYALQGQGFCQTGFGNHEEAIRLLRQAAAIFDDAHNDFARGTTWDWIGVAFQRLGRYGESIESFQRAVRIYQACDAKFDQVEANIDLGKSFLLAGDPASARQAWQVALAICTELDLVEFGAEVRKHLAQLNQPTS